MCSKGPSCDWNMAEADHYYEVTEQRIKVKAPSSRRGGVRVTLWKRCLLFLFLQIGCLALDHRTSELAYEEDEIRLILGHPFPAKSIKLLEEGNEGASLNSQSHGNGILSFHPKSFDFKESPVGMPRLGLVRVDNRLTDENLKLISISGSTVHFHSSFFADKIISPGSNTTFEVVFLSRAEGQVESNLYIHTSKGLFKYHVQGFGLPNPYRLKPLVGARIPVNGSYEPLITMHNPHNQPIQVVEMLSSGSDFYLALPDGVPEEGEGAAWAIEPFQTKPVMKGTFQGKAEGNHTGYIKIRVNSTNASSEYLLVPVEVQVSSKPGIYSPQEALDFGLLVRSDKPKTLSLSLINSLETPINVQSVSVKGDPNSAIRFEFRPIVVEPDSAVSTVVALVTFDPSEAHSPKESHGTIEIRSESGDFITVPFRATVLQGELQHNTSALGFFIKADQFHPRNFSVRNTFPATVAIYQVSVSHPELVEIVSFNESHVMGPGEQKDIFRVRVERRNDLCDSKTPVQLTLKSNITNLLLPITCYDGKLQLHTLDGDEVKFGRVELYSTHMEYFSVANANPVEIRLKSWGSNTSYAHVDLVGMQKGLKEDLVKIQDFDSLKKSLFLQPGHMAVFSIQVRRPTLEGVFWGESFVTTDHNQTLRVPFHFSVSKGSIHSDVITFDKAFPGKISLEKLHLTSSFNQTLGLRGVWSTPAAPMWFSSSSVQDNPDIPPHRKTCVGKIHFDPKQFCHDMCYAGFLIDSPLGKEWRRASDMDWETGEIDWTILKTLQKRYEHVKDVTVSNVSLWLETTEGKDFKLTTQVNYAWPRLTSSKVLVFPLTALGNDTIVDIPVTNPTNAPLFVQALLATDYGPGWKQFVHGNGVGGNLTEGNIVFSLSGLGSSSSQSQDATVLFSQVQRQIVEDMLNLKQSSAGLSFLLPPGAKFHLRARFKPISKDLASTLLLIRSNMTGIETMWLKGRAGTGQLTLGNGSPGSSLIFQITDKLLQGCQRETANKYVPPQMTVRRSFIARNVGEIPLDIQVVEIYPAQGTLSFWASFALGQGDPCEGYGFRILNCQPFTLLPNHTHSVDIAFTPDFTMSRVVRTLRLTDVNGAHFNYSMVAMIPSGLLGVCSAALVRPTWETALKYVLVGGLILGIAAACLMAYFEAGTIVSSAVVATVRVVPAETSEAARNDGKETTKLDLKSVYDKVDNRFKRNQQQLNGQQSSKSSNPGSSARSNSPSSSSPASGSSVSPASTSSTASSSSSNLRNRKKSIPKVLNTSDVSNQKKKEADLSLSAKVTEDVSNNNNTSINNNNANLNGKYGGKTKKKGKGQRNGQRFTPPTPPSGSSHLPSSPTPKVEEETSSTTTESSNADDLSFMNLMDEGVVGKDPPAHEKPNETPAPPPKEKSQGGKKKEVKVLNTAPQNQNQNGFYPPPGFENTLNNRNPNQGSRGQYGSTKKKQVSGSSSSGSHGSGSPNQELSLAWDVSSSFRNSSNAGSTSSFSMNDVPEFSRHRGNEFYPRSTVNDHEAGFESYNLHQNSYGNRSQHQGSVYQGSNGGYTAPRHAQSQSRPRAGVIGQPRFNPGGSSTQQTFVNGVLTTMAVAMNAPGKSVTSGPAGRSGQQTRTTNTTASNPWGGGELYDPDIWNRRKTSSTNSPPSYTGDGYNAFYQKPREARRSGDASADMYGQPNMNSDMIGMWHMNYENGLQSRAPGAGAPPTSQFNPLSSYPATTLLSVPQQVTNSQNQHGFVTRMRSDPATRNRASYQPQNTWKAPLFYGNEREQREMDSLQTLSNASTGRGLGLNASPPERSGGWPSPTSTPALDVFSDWGQRSGREAAEIWETPAVSLSDSTSWTTPVSYGNGVSLASVYPDSGLGTGSIRSDSVPLAITDIRSHADLVQSQREVEAGLGFNPFTSDIWGQSDASPNWNPPASTSASSATPAFRYNPDPQ